MFHGNIINFHVTGKSLLQEWPRK